MVDESPRKLTAATLTGMSWSTLNGLTVALIQVLYVAVMSRLLEPRLFGLMAIANLAVNFGANFARMGVAQALIQKPTLSRDEIRAGFTAGLAFGVLCCAGLWVLAPWIANEVFGEPEAVLLLRVMGTHFIFLGLGMTSQGLLRRSLRFRELAIAQIAAYLLGYGVVGLGMAAAGAGVWSLAGGVLAANLLHLGFQYMWARHPLRPVLSVRKFGALYNFGARISVLGFYEFLGKQLDTISVGRYTTTALLGQYSRAFVLTNLPLSHHLSHAITRVLFPGFSRIQADPRRLKRAYLSLLTLGGTIMFSLGAGMAVAADEIVHVALGDQWDVAARVIPFFALAVVLNIMTKFAELLCESRAELNKVLAVQTIYLVLLAAAYVAVSGIGGIVPFAATLAASEVLRHTAFTALLRKVVGIRPGEVVRAYAPAIFSAGGVAAAIAVGRQPLLANDVAPLGIFAAELALGAVAVILCLRFNPFGHVRGELYSRLVAARLIGTRNTLFAKVAGVVLGRRHTVARARP